MKFHFEFDIKKLPRPLTHHDNMLLIGSCFTENIGEKLARHKFHVLENPHGILFNPVSVAEALTDCINAKKYDSADLFCYNEAWHSWKHHSRFSGITIEDALQKINASVQYAHAYLKKADHVLITLGSSWLYTLTGEALNGVPGSIAANNHKAPAAWFAKRLMNEQEVVLTLETMLQKLFAFNPAIQVIFTISPVRHLREGVIENNRSKAVLIQSVHSLVDKYEQLYYFPAYELVIDDLRDYRFYAEDLVHPNYHATQYVWQKFENACMSEKTKEIAGQIAEINIARQHKAFNPLSEQHKKFLQIYFSKTKSLQEKYPFIDLGDELNYFSVVG